MAMAALEEKCVSVLPPQAEQRTDSGQEKRKEADCGGNSRSLTEGQQALGELLQLAVLGQQPTQAHRPERREVSRTGRPRSPIHSRLQLIEQLIQPTHQPQIRRLPRQPPHRGEPGCHQETDHPPLRQPLHHPQVMPLQLLQTKLQATRSRQSQAVEDQAMAGRELKRSSLLP